MDRRLLLRVHTRLRPRLTLSSRPDVIGPSAAFGSRSSTGIGCGPCRSARNSGVFVAHLRAEFSRPAHLQPAGLLLRAALIWHHSFRATRTSSDLIVAASS